MVQNNQSEKSFFVTTDVNLDLQSLELLMRIVLVDTTFLEKLDSFGYDQSWKFFAGLSGNDSDYSDYDFVGWNGKDRNMDLLGEVHLL